MTWVFFRAKTFDTAWQVLKGMFGANDDAEPILPMMHLVMVTLIVGGLVFAHWQMRNRTLESAIARTPALLVSGVWALMAFAIVIAQGIGQCLHLLPVLIRRATWPCPSSGPASCGRPPRIAPAWPSRCPSAMFRRSPGARVSVRRARAVRASSWPAGKPTGARTASTPGYRNSDGEWAAQRRRIDNGEGNKTVLIGASRVLFDVQLPVWERLTGERPIQLAMEGTSPMPMLEDLAADPHFTGRLLVGVAPDVFFTGFAYRGRVVPYYHKQGPSQRIGNWLSMTFLEPYFAFYDPDYALATVVRRQAWPARPGLEFGMRVRKLMMQVSTDRESHMWRKVEVDPDYRALCRRIWAEDFGKPLPGMETPAGKKKIIDGEIAKAVAAISDAALARRAGRVRPPALQRRVLRVRTEVPSARRDLGPAAATHRRAGHPLRGLPAAAGLRDARVVAHVGLRSEPLHGRAGAAGRGRIQPDGPAGHRSCALTSASSGRSLSARCQIACNAA